MRYSSILLLSFLPLAAQVEVIKRAKAPAALQESLWLLPGGSYQRMPPKGAVNAPGHIQQVAPGQRVALGVVAMGEGREKLLLNRTLNVRFTSSAGVVEKKDVKPMAIRSIKAVGSDMALGVMESVGISGQEKALLEKQTVMTDMAIFEVDWQAPALTKPETLTIEATLVGGATPLPALKPAHLLFRPWTDWQPTRRLEEKNIQEMIHAFPACPQPGYLMVLLQAAACTKALEQPPVYSFFAHAFREHPLAKQEAVKLLPSLGLLSKWALLMVMKLQGEEITPHVAGLSDDNREFLLAVPPLSDPRVFAPYVDPVDPQRLPGMGVQMDHCWGAWMATGDASYVRPLVDMLAYAPDFPTYEAWVNTKGGAKGVNARVARGMAYQIAGWSLSSFQTMDPQMADWLRFWQQDDSVPLMVQEQIRKLQGNPAFRRPKQ